VKLKNKVLSTLIATVLVLSMMVGTALAQTHELPFDYPEDAGYVSPDNDVWVVLFGGAAAPPLTDDEALRDSIRSVDVIISGNATFDAHIVANGPSWTPHDFYGQSVDGETTINIPYDMTGVGYTEVVVNLKNKSEGPLQITRMDFKDADGNVVLAHGAASDAAPVEEPADDNDDVVEVAETAPEAPAKTETAPKTGLVSSALLLGLGAVAFGTGAVVLKKKED